MVTKNQAIYHNNKYNGLENKEKEPSEPVDMNTYQINNYRKNVTRLHFEDEPKVQGRQLVKDQRSCISLSVAYLTTPTSNQEHQPRDDNSIPCMTAWQIYTEQLQEKETSCNELRTTIQVSRKSERQHFSSRTDPSQGFIQAILMSVRRHKKLNLLIEFSNSIFIKFYLKTY